MNRKIKVFLGVTLTLGSLLAGRVPAKAQAGCEVWLGIYSACVGGWCNFWLPSFPQQYVICQSGCTFYLNSYVNCVSAPITACINQGTAAYWNCFGDPANNCYASDANRVICEGACRTLQLAQTAICFGS